jgi:hypothetical protein
MSWASRTSSIRVGDRVCFSARFCRGTGQQTGDLPFARGEVKELQTLGGEIKLAVVDWDTPDIPERVSVNHLSRVTERGILE